MRLPPARAHSATSVQSTLQRTSLRPPAGRCYLALSDATQSDALSIILQDFSSFLFILFFLELLCSVLHDVSLSKTLYSAHTLEIYGVSFDAQRGSVTFTWVISVSTKAACISTFSYVLHAEVQEEASKDTPERLPEVV